MRESYRSLARAVRYETPKVKGSRFIADAAPAADAAAADAFVETIRREFHRASHHCFAFRLGPDGAEFRSSDDGEPGGSAGRPILQQIEGHELTDAVVVVTRYFGGTKLGVGGLVRAYGGAAGALLDRAELRTIAITRQLRVEYPYDLSGEVQAVLSACGLRPSSSEFGEVVRLVLDVPAGDADRLAHELRERTAGRAEIELAGSDLTS